MTAPRETFVLFELMNAMLLVAEEAKRRGYRVVALNREALQDSGPFAVPDGLVDELIPIRSWAEPDRLAGLLAELADRDRVVGTYSVFEATLVAEASLRELAGLPTTSPANTERVLDKLRVRQLLSQAGLSRLDSVSLTEALRWPSWQFAGPAVLKPTHGTGSALCFMVADLDQLRAAAEQAAEAPVVNQLMREYIVSHGQFVLEEQAVGELLSVESLVVDGRVHHVGLTGRYLLAADPVVEQGLFFPYPHPQSAEIVEFAERVHACLEIGHGATHLEVMVGPAGIELIDFNPRFAGFASVVSFSEAFGVPFAGVLTDLACGRPLAVDWLGRPSRYAVEMVLLPPRGTTELQEIRFPDGVLAGRATKKPGQRLSGRADQLDAVGMFIVSGETPGQAHNRALAARRQTEVNGRPLADDPNNVLIFPAHLGVPTPLTRRPEAAGRGVT